MPKRLFELNIERSQLLSENAKLVKENASLAKDNERLQGKLTDYVNKNNALHLTVNQLQWLGMPKYKNPWREL